MYTEGFMRLGGMRAVFTKQRKLRNVHEKIQAPAHSPDFSSWPYYVQL